MLLGRKGIDVNEPEKIFNITRRRKLKLKALKANLSESPLCVSLEKVVCYCVLNWCPNDIAMSHSFPILQVNLKIIQSSLKQLQRVIIVSYKQWLMMIWNGMAILSGHVYRSIWINEISSPKTTNYLEMYRIEIWRLLP